MPGEAEIDHLHAPVRGEQEIARLDVAMDEVSVVRGLKAGRGLSRPLAGTRDRLRSVIVNEVLDVAARDELEHQVMHGRFARAGRGQDSRVECRHEVRVVERCQRPHLGTESANELGGDVFVDRQHLDRNPRRSMRCSPRNTTATLPPPSRSSTRYGPRTSPKRHRHDAIALIFGDDPGMGQSGAERSRVVKPASFRRNSPGTP